MIDLWQRFQTEVKANGKKAGLLAGLFLFGCCFWVPMLVRAISPKQAAAASLPGQSTSTDPALSGIAPGMLNPGNPAGQVDPGSDQFWSNLSDALACDPMYRSADIQRLSRNPFEGNEPAEPAPVQLAQEPAPPAVEESQDEAVRPEELILTSTIIGKTRRAALINGQVYQVGRRLQANGHSYLVTKVESNRVVLTGPGETIELTLARPQLKDVLGREDSAVSPDR